MPLVEKYTNDYQSNIAIWRMDESIDTLTVLANEHGIDLRKEQYKNESQHREYLASRLALKSIDTNFRVNESTEKKAPSLVNNDTKISISHCKKMCAVISNSIKPVGIDIEVVTPRILSISERFMNVDELQFLTPTDNLRMQFIMWSCKESVFKKYHSLHLDFRKHMRILPFNLETCEYVFCEISCQHIHIREKISVQFFDDVVLTHTL
jgi:4'-phosphopantetheinyl transferase EntD